MEGRRTGLPEVIEAMTRPELYTPRPAGVELRQTHISYVFLAGDFVYKVKKPVSFTFLDSSTLAARYHFCREEVRLNRRLAPDIYLGVFPVFQQGKRFVLGPEAHAFDPCAIEYFVRMRRLPEDRMLDRLALQGRADPDTIATIVRRLAAFHATASSELALTYGSADAVRRMVMENLAECRGLTGYTIPAGEFSVIERFIDAFVEAHRTLMDDRALGGLVREGHGDLRCEHICLADGIEIFDCVEFSEQLRYGDVASEIAFLAMDLERLGAQALAERLVSYYGELTGDDDLAIMVRFYKCYRALVRGKVESLASMEAEMDKGAKERARQSGAACFGLAARYARRESPAVIAVCGCSGTGKSTVARMLGKRLGFRVLSSDRIRKRLAHIAETERARADYTAGIYSRAFTRSTYEALVTEAQMTVGAGCGVILDATFKSCAQRHAVLEMAARAGVPVLFVECIAEETEVLRRLRERQNRTGEVSDATVEVYLRQRAEFPRLTEVPGRSRITVDTTQPANAALERIESALKSLQA